MNDVQIRNQKLYYAVLSDKQGDTIGTDKRGAIARGIVDLAMETNNSLIVENFSKAIESWDEDCMASCELAPGIHFIVSATMSGRNIEVDRIKAKS